MEKRTKNQITRTNVHVALSGKQQNKNSNHITADIDDEKSSAKQETLESAIRN